MAPGESLAFTFDFATRPLAVGETLTSVGAVTVVTTDENAQSTLAVSATSISGTKLLFTLSGQIASQTFYVVTILVNTSAGIRAAVVEVYCTAT